MSLAPDPDKFARANNTINATINPTAPVATPAITSPVTSPTALTSGYQRLQQSIFPSLAQQQMSTQPITPSTAYAAAAKQIEQSPWNPEPAAQPSNFLNPITGQTAQKVPVAQPANFVNPATGQSQLKPTTKSPSLSGWTAPLPNSSLPLI